jgi:hypothetical protein
MKPMTYIVTHDGIRGYIIRETEPRFYEIRWSGGKCVMHESCLTIDPLMEEEQ